MYLHKVNIFSKKHETRLVYFLLENKVLDIPCDYMKSLSVDIRLTEPLLFPKAISTKILCAGPKYIL